MTENATDDSESTDDRVPCEWPECEDTFGTSKGMKIHHAHSHGELLGVTTLECEYCGDEFSEQTCRKDETRFCSKECVYRYRHESGSVTITCQECQDTFSVAKSQADTRVYCSEDCHHSAQRTSVEKECVYCNDTYLAEPNYADSSRYCSRSCKDQARGERFAGEDHPRWKGGKATLTCTHCGGTYKKQRSQTDESRFCSRDCLSAWQSEYFLGPNSPLWAGGHKYITYGVGFTEKKKERIRKRQNRRCAGCGTHTSAFDRKLHVHHIRKARLVDDDEERNDDDNLVALCPACHPKWDAMSPLRPQTDIIE